MLPSSEEHEVSFKPIELLLEPDKKDQLDLMVDTETRHDTDTDPFMEPEEGDETRHFMETKKGDQIELDGKFVEYLLKNGIIQKKPRRNHY